MSIWWASFTLTLKKELNFLTDILDFFNKTMMRYNKAIIKIEYVIYLKNNY